MIEPTNLDRHRTDDSTKTVTFRCEDGYRVNGSITSACVFVPGHDMGSWNSAQPTCSAIRCHPLPKIDHTTGYNTSSVHHYPDNITINCIPGYTTIGTSVLRCQTDGTWSTPSPHCTAIQCNKQSLNLKQYLTVTPDGHSYNYQDTVIMTCKPGFTGFNVTSKCIAMNHWSEKQPICDLTTCSNPSRSMNRNITLEPVKTSYNYLDTVTMTCKPGYTGINVTSQCIAMNHWSKLPPTCNSEFCASDSVPHYLRMASSKQKYKVGENTTFYCNYGFNGITTLSTCTSLNTWTPPLPVCNRISCIQENKSTLYVPSKDIYDYTEEVIISCLPGLTGKTTKSKCSSMNTWDPLPPKCSESCEHFDQLNGVSYTVYGGTTAAIVILGITAFILFVLWTRRKAKEKEKLYEDIKVDSDQRLRNENPDEAYSELTERSEYWNTDPYRSNTITVTDTEH